MDAGNLIYEKDKGREHQCFCITFAVLNFDFSNCRLADKEKSCKIYSFSSHLILVCVFAMSFLHSQGLDRYIYLGGRPGNHPDPQICLQSMLFFGTEK